MSDKELVDMIVKMADVVQVLTGLVLEREEGENRDKAVKQLLNVIRIKTELLSV